MRYGRGGHEDGAPFDGTGIGRECLLLIWERILYELGSRSGRKRKKKAERVDCATRWLISSVHVFLCFLHLFDG